MRHPSLFDWGRIGTTAACVGEFRQRRYLLSRPLALALAAFLLFTSVMPTRLGNGRRDRRHQLDQSGHEVQQQSHVVHWQLTSSPWGMGGAAWTREACRWPSEFYQSDGPRRNRSAAADDCSAYPTPRPSGRPFAERSPERPWTVPRTVAVDGRRMFPSSKRISTVNMGTVKLTKSVPITDVM